MIYAIDAEIFYNTKTCLRIHGDLFVWGTQFLLKKKFPKTPSGIELVPVPPGFLYPAGVTVISRSGESNNSAETRTEKRVPSSDGKILKPLGTFPIESYYLAYIKDVDGYPGVKPFFIGRKQVWDDSRITNFMLSKTNTDLIADKSICLPLSEGATFANLRRTIQVAWENGAIPVFSERLPQSDGVSAVCDTILDLPTGAVIPSAAAKEYWAQLLSSCSASPRSSLADFKERITELLHAETEDRLSVRVYLLRFQARNQEVTHPAVVIATL